MTDKGDGCWKYCFQCQNHVVHDEFGSVDSFAVFFCGMQCLTDWANKSKTAIRGDEL